MKFDDFRTSWDVAYDKFMKLYSLENFKLFILIIKFENVPQLSLRRP